MPASTSMTFFSESIDAECPSAGFFTPGPVCTPKVVPTDTADLRDYDLLAPAAELPALEGLELAAAG